jgi:hypothetical protein
MIVEYVSDGNVKVHAIKFTMEVKANARNPKSFPV